MNRSSLERLTIQKCFERSEEAFRQLRSHTRDVAAETYVMTILTKLVIAAQTRQRLVGKTASSFKIPNCGAPRRRSQPEKCSFLQELPQLRNPVIGSNQQISRSNLLQ